MKSSVRHKLIALLLVSAALFTCLGGCSSARVDTPEATQSPGTTATVPPTIIPEITGDDRFTICGDTESPLNPFLAETEVNLQASQLLYETLFALDSLFQPQPVLCSDFSTQDGITYDFTIVSGVLFHDGNTLTAEDVVYSLRRSRSSSLYSNRLDSADSITVTGDLTFTIVLSEPNYKLPSLLDIPIIKNNSGDEAVPAGTGPYHLYSGPVPAGNDPYLISFKSHRSASSAPVEKIYLHKYTGGDAYGAFAEQLLDLMVIDPAQNKNEFGIDYEIRRYDTTTLHYLAFNTKNMYLADARMRLAISYAIDRDNICGDIFSGNLLASPMLISPASPYYTESWNTHEGYSLKALSTIFNGYGLADRNNDGFLEFPGSEDPFSLVIAVNDDNPLKVEMAEALADTLKSVGVFVTLNVLPWDDYVTALDKGEFDICYAQVRLTADFDFSAILSTDGKLNYGGYSDENMDKLLDAYLSAGTESAVSAAAGSLCVYAAETMPIIPIGYDRLAVISHRNVISGLEPTQNGIYTGILNWTISLD